ncbi:MAG: protein translocase subunit SecD [Pseudomonadota bacterium]
MQRFARWKIYLVAAALLLASLYTLPNFFPQVPAVFVAPRHEQLAADIEDQIRKTLEGAKIPFRQISLESKQLVIRFPDVESQLKARDSLQKGFEADNTLALNLVSDAPTWLRQLGASPMFLGLDLRGGVHFQLKVDTRDTVGKSLDTQLADIRRFVREKQIDLTNSERTHEKITLTLNPATPPATLMEQLNKQYAGVLAIHTQTNIITLEPTPAEFERLSKAAVDQNMAILHKRVNELGIAEPIVQRQGTDRIVVELPGVQDIARAKEILGRTATLDLRIVSDDQAGLAAARSGQMPPVGTELLKDRQGNPILVKRQSQLTGNQISDAQPGFDQQTQEPVVHISLDKIGSRIFEDLTRENIGRRMAILLVEKNKTEVITAPTIRERISGGRVQISGSMNTQEAQDISLLMRAGALAAPMDIIEERTVGPSLGLDNIQKGFQSVLYGFAILSAFIMLYYRGMGIIATISLIANVALLVGILSLLQATLTLPGIAAIALTLGMAIDANVLINERIREELREGAKPHVAIEVGYDQAWRTILDSNITTLIAGLALFAFGSGPIKGFAVVHCLGILTSMFSAVLVSRCIVYLIYGRFGSKLGSISIGHVWKGKSTATSPTKAASI